MKPTKEYDWKFDRVNSQGEVIFRHNTNETVEQVIKFLEDKNVEYELTEGAGSTMFWIYCNATKYSYYSTTGRWSPIKKNNYPTKHYSSTNIKDFYERFLLAKNEFKPTEEKVENVETILKDNKIEYKIKKDTITLTTKVIPRKDGKGNRRRYSYEYIVGKGKWRNINSDGTPNEKFYQVSNIENFLTKFFNDDIEVVKHETK